MIGPNLHSRSIADKLRANPNYVHLAVSYGGVVVSGNVNSPMPAWSYEVGGPLNEQQIEAVVTLVEGWAAEAAEAPRRGGARHARGGRGGLRNRPAAPAATAPSSRGRPRARTSRPSAPASSPSGLPVEPSGLDQMIADYEEDPRNFLELWIRDSAANYNDGEPTGMPPHPEGSLSESQLTGADHVPPGADR